MASSAGLVLNGSYTWIFSGIGTSLALGVIGWFWRKQKKYPGSGSIPGQTTHQELRGNSSNQLSVTQNTGTVNQGQNLHIHNGPGMLAVHHHYGDHQTEAATDCFSVADITIRLEAASVFEKHTVEESFRGARATGRGQLKRLMPSSSGDLWLLKFSDPERSLRDLWVRLPKTQLDGYRLQAYPNDQIYEITGTLESASTLDFYFARENLIIRPE